MKKYGKRRSQQERNLREIEKELDQDEGNHVCFFYPNHPKTEYDHIVPKSQNTYLIDCKENLCPIGRYAHNTLTFGTVDDILGLPPDRFKEYLDRMKLLDEKYHRRYIRKFKDWGHVCYEVT